MTTALDRPKQRDRIALKAVHDDNLVSYLRSLGLNPDAPTISRCKFCGTDVTLENLAAIFPQGGDVKVACEKADCLMELQELIREGVVQL